MSLNRRLRKARHDLHSAEVQMDRAACAKYRAPLWRRLAAWLGHPVPLNIHRVRWERKHKAAIKAAKKVAARVMVGRSN